MAGITGETVVKFEGREYRLRLTMRGFATLQSEFGNDVLKELDTDATPDISLYLRVVELALGKEADRYEGDLADEILGRDTGIVAEILLNFLPSAEAVKDDAQEPTKGASPEKKAKAARG